MFLAGWTEYVLRNPEQEEAKLKTNLAGINVVLDYYSRGEAFGVKYDKNMEWLIEKQTMGELEKYIKRETGSRTKEKK